MMYVWGFTNTIILVFMNLYFLLSMKTKNYEEVFAGFKHNFHFSNDLLFCLLNYICFVSPEVLKMLCTLTNVAPMHICTLQPNSNDALFLVTCSAYSFVLLFFSLKANFECIY